MPSSPGEIGSTERSVTKGLIRLASAGNLSVGAERIEIIVAAGAIARHVVDEWVAPRVLGHGVSLKIRSAPAGYPRRAGDQRLQSLFRRRIGSNVEFVNVEHARQPFDRLM